MKGRKCMDIKKFIIIVYLCITLPVQAQQFKQWGGVIVNKQAVTHVILESRGVTFYYSAGTGFDEVYHTTIKCKTTQEKNQKFNEVYRWLNERN